MPNVRTKLRIQGIALSTFALLFVNALQTIFAIITVGLVSPDISSNSPSTKPTSEYIIVVSVMTMLTVGILVYCALIPPTKIVGLYVLATWEFILGVLWAISAGLLGSAGGRGRLRAALVLSLLEMISLLTLSVMGCVGLCCVSRRLGRDKP